MTSLKYDKVYSQLFSKVEAYDFLELPEDTLNEFLCNWLHSASANPYVRKLFSSFKLDDIIQEIQFEVKYSVDADADKEFIVEVLATGLMIAWLEPKVKSLNNLTKMYGSKEEKWYSEANHLREMNALLQDCKKEQRRMIADRGSIWNTYLDGE